jgi:hypothetical protein
MGISSPKSMGNPTIFAKAALAEGTSTIDVIEQLQARYGLSPKEAEALVDDIEENEGS